MPSKIDSRRFPRRFGVSPWRKQLNSCMELIRCKKKEIILDAGSGSAPYAGLFFDALLIRLDANAQYGVDVVADLANLPFRESTFDKIICTEVLEHLKNYEGSIKSFHRVLKHNGCLIMSTPFLYPIHDAPNDYQRFTKFKLEQLLKIFNQVEIKGLGGFFTTTLNLLYSFLSVKFGLFGYLISSFSFISKILDGLDKSGNSITGYFIVAIKE